MISPVLCKSEDCRTHSSGECPHCYCPEACDGSCLKLRLQYASLTAANLYMLFQSRLEEVHLSNLSILRDLQALQ